MKGKFFIIITFIQITVLILLVNANASDLWQAPFDTTVAKSESTDSLLSLDDILVLVAAENSSFRSFNYQLQAAQNNLKQAGHWPNPEFETELEEFGWDASGFDESEIAISLAQEFEFFGQRSARKNVAKSEIDATKLHIKLSAFDLYLETKQRFYALAHAQQKVELSEASVALAKEIVDNIYFRLDNGIGLQSEHLLAQLEQQRSLLALEQAKQDVIVLESILVSLWKGEPSGVELLTCNNLNLAPLIDKIDLLSNQIDSTRSIMQLQSELEILKKEKILAAAEACPNVMLRGGFKRLTVDNSKSFHLGIALPIPLFNRNQGTRRSLDAQQRSLEYTLEQSKIEAASVIQSHIIQLKKLVDKHAVFDSLLLPTANEAYRKLQNAYESGRVPYIQLLEAKRALNDLSFEHNDMLLEIQEQIIALESLTGVTMRTKLEN
jgi:cobalt-zinc-cadmium efflux system outer membrane protein